MVSVREIRGEGLPVYEGEVPRNQEILKVDSGDLRKVEDYIAFHYEEFDYDFRNDDEDDEIKEEREVKVVDAICRVLNLNADDPLVKKYLKAVLTQLKRGIQFDNPAPSSISGQRSRPSGKLLAGARKNGIRTGFRVGR